MYDRVLLIYNKLFFKPLKCCALSLEYMNKYKTTLILVVLALQISTLLLAKNYKGAEYRTSETFLYGRFEVSMKPANRIGVISSFFTYHEISSTADWNEIDIENVGRYDDMIQFNPITRGQINHVRNEPITFNQYEDFHTYAFEWTPDYVAWFIDDVEVHRQAGEHINGLNLSQKIMMNIWNPDYDNWVGTWNDYSLPTFSFYDWVSYSSYTPGTGNYGTNNNFTNQWRDEFDTFDTARWGKATHTWQGNMCDFITNNAVIKDGKLILCLTDATNTGYKDVTKPTLIWAKAFKNGNIEIKFSEELNKASAETIGNYTVPGATIVSAELSGDLTKVTLYTSNFNPTVTTNLIAMNINDLWGNSISVAAKTIIPTSVPEFPVKINVGGNAVSNYWADQLWDETNAYGYMDSQDGVWPGNTQIANTTEDLIYLTDGEGTKKYLVRVPNNQYTVTLMFAEKYFDSPGKRLFDITIEDILVADNVDIFAEVGKNTAYDFTQTVSVNDELLEIILSAEIDQATLSGIKIEINPNSVGYNYNHVDKYELLQNYPNPFNPSTKIEYTLQNKSNVKLKIYDVLGNEIATLINKVQEAGKYSQSFSSNGFGKELVSGIYFYQLQTENYIKTKKMLLLK